MKPQNMPAAPKRWPLVSDREEARQSRLRRLLPVDAFFLVVVVAIPIGFALFVLGLLLMGGDS